MAKTVVEEHKELIHYTSAAGLAGILSSQALWATHSSFLNDSSEITLFFDRRLRQLLEVAVRSELADSDLQLLPQFARTAQQADETIGRYASELTHAIRTTTMQFNEPYIISFCTAKDKRLRNDGLLGQWRGYGKDGGYAIVFDTGGLQELLNLEAKAYWYQQVRWGDVHYYQDDADAQLAAEEIVEAEETLKKAVRGFLKNPNPVELEPTFEPMATLSCLYKHWGFHEEQELRIVAIPPNAELLTEGRLQGESRPRRPTKSFVRGGCPVPYLELFGRVPEGAEPSCLPITRILIGPHPQKDLRKRAVESMLEACNIQAEVVVSQIPYIGA